MKIDFDYKKYLDPKKLQPVIKAIVKYQIIIGSIIVAAIFYYLVSRINTFAGVEKDQERFDAGMLEVNRITFDQEAIDKIRDLQDRSVDVKLDLPGDRENPF